MHRAILLLALLCGLGITANAQGNAAVFYGYHNDRQFVFTITPELLDSSPDWEEGQDNPPLPARRALEAAATYLPQLVPNAEEWHSMEIRLVPVNKKWVYVVGFSEQKERLSSKFVIVVLMNGRVVDPKINERKTL